MANPRQDEKSAKNIEDTAHRTSERTAEQTSRIGQAAAEQTTRVGQAAAEAGEEVSRVGADLLRQNAETLQNALRLGLEMATAVMGRSTDQRGPKCNRQLNGRPATPQPSCTLALRLPKG